MSWLEAINKVVALTDQRDNGGLSATHIREQFLPEERTNVVQMLWNKIAQKHPDSRAVFFAATTMDYQEAVGYFEASQQECGCPFPVYPLNLDMDPADDELEDVPQMLSLAWSQNFDVYLTQYFKDEALRRHTTFFIDLSAESSLFYPEFALGHVISRLVSLPHYGGSTSPVDHTYTFDIITFGAHNFPHVAWTIECGLNIDQNIVNMDLLLLDDKSDDLFDEVEILGSPEEQNEHIVELVKRGVNESISSDKRAIIVLIMDAKRAEDAILPQLANLLPGDAILQMQGSTSVLFYDLVKRHRNLILLLVDPNDESVRGNWQLAHALTTGLPISHVIATGTKRQIVFDTESRLFVTNRDVLVSRATLQRRRRWVQKALARSGVRPVCSTTYTQEEKALTRLPYDANPYDSHLLENTYQIVQTWMDQDIRSVPAPLIRQIGRFKLCEALRRLWQICAIDPQDDTQTAWRIEPDLDSIISRFAFDPPEFERTRLSTAVLLAHTEQLWQIGIISEAVTRTLVRLAAILDVGLAGAMKVDIPMLFPRWQDPSFCGTFDVRIRNDCWGTGQKYGGRGTLWMTLGVYENVLVGPIGHIWNVLPGDTTIRLAGGAIEISAEIFGAFMNRARGFSDGINISMWGNEPPATLSEQEVELVDGLLLQVHMHQLVRIDPETGMIFNFITGKPFDHMGTVIHCLDWARVAELSHPTHGTLGICTGHFDHHNTGVLYPGDLTLISPVAVQRVQEQVGPLPSALWQDEDDSAEPDE